MDLLSSLRSGRESILSNGVALATTADNISNSNTLGYKGSRTEFGDLLAGGSGSLFGDVNSVGNGTFVDQIALLTEQGPVDNTGRSLDAAIQGNGFFTFQDGDDFIYSRAGNLNVDADGNLVNADGFTLMGFTTTSPTSPVALNVAAVSSTANPTTSIKINGNLNANSTPIAAVPAGTTFNELNAGAEFRSLTRIYDSLGQGHDVQLYFFHTGPLGWTANAYVDAADTGGVAGTPVQVGTLPFTFDPSGIQLAATPMTLNATWGNGAAPSTTAIDFSGMTDFASPSNFSSIVADGNAAGAVVGTEITQEGTVNALLDNQQRVAIGTVALSTFNNAAGLERIGDNNFRSSEISGTAKIGAPGTEGRGSIVPESLENSNVDIAGQFIDVIRYQRAYQAGSQVIQTSNDLLNTTIQIA